ncbi:G5 domain-containing protein [Micromonospora echinospora]|uniref:G5 domain-containing protein n=1 Tax=Micromonospora echinospora TaxID=1877 RepID=UPI0033E89963
MTQQPPPLPPDQPPSGPVPPPGHLPPPGYFPAPGGPLIAGQPGWFRRLTAGQRTALLIGAGALTFVLLCCGGLTVVGATAEPPQESRAAAAAGAEEPSAYAEPTVASPPAAPPSSAPPPTPSLSPSSVPSTPASPPSPVVEVRTETATEQIPHGTRTVKDSSLAEGKRVVRTPGVDGVRTLTYQVTVTDGVQTGRKLVRSAVTRKPVTEVVAVGTKPARRCDPNYSGCVPIASDVDCAGGGGNGPAYVTGPVRVIGSDIYDLDRDNDGYGCDD